MNENVLKIIPLGGFGEIGKNMLVIEYEQDILIIDCGLKFPEADLHGVDIIIADFTYLQQNYKKIRALLITHGHEDHIGAVPYFLSQFKVAVFGTRLTLGLIKNKLKEFKLDREDSLYEVKARDRMTLGLFRVEFITVNHSIAGSLALAVQTPVGTIIHTGDIKIDSNPVDKAYFDFYTFARYGERGVLLLMSDSTNAERDGFTRSESITGKKIGAIVAKAKGRVIVASFASNIHRLQQVITVLKENNRKIVLSGMSIIKNVELAHQLGYLEMEQTDIISPNEIKNYPPEQMAIITTGSQGEPYSALTRMANRTHPHISILKGDTVVISASVIPGNERAVGHTINRLMVQGAQVEYHRGNGIHVSGHGSQEELKILFNLTRPRFFIPIHGEFRHLMAHREIALEMNIPEKNIAVALNGEMILTDGNHIVKKGNVPASDMYVDGLGIGDVGPSVLKDRAALAESGIIITTIVLSQDGFLLEEPRFNLIGVVFSRRMDELLDDLKLLVERLVEKWQHTKKKSGLDNKVRSGIRRLVLTRLGRKPLLHIEIVNTAL